MADRFANGLKLTAPAGSQCGRTFARWLVEWLTQICGWSVVDAVAGNWTNYVAQGTVGLTVTGQPGRLDIGAGTYTFTSADIGSYLTITGFTGRYVGRKGIYRIASIVTTKIVELEIKAGVHEDGLPADATGLTWKLWAPTASYVPTSTNVIVLGGTGTTGAGYPFHLHINVRATNSYFPEFRVSPFASWNAGTHAWSDSRYTAALGIDSWNNSLVNVDTIRVFGAGDSDRAMIMFRTEDDYWAWHLCYLGEIVARHPTLDTNPVMMWIGCNRGNSTVGDDNATLFGYGYDSNAVGGGRGLGYDNLTTISYVATFPHNYVGADSHLFCDTQRWWSEFSRKRYLQSVIIESQTASHMEFRGTWRRAWLTSRDMPRLTTFGANAEFLHVVGGVAIPWNNSKAKYERA